MDNNTIQKQKRIILLLSILLAIVILALIGVLWYYSCVSPATTSAVVTDNIISPDIASTETGSSVSCHNSILPKKLALPNTGSSQIARTSNDQASDSGEVLSLYSGKETDNTPFYADNMFPGDILEKRYDVRVSHSKTVTVFFHADIRQGYEKLAEVLQVRIAVKGSVSSLYDGLMRDMPESLAYTITADQATESDLLYDITVYLDTSVGNEYMEKDLIADFRWWVEDTEPLTPPKTGDQFRLFLWIGLAAASLLLIILLVILLRKRRRRDEKQA